MEFSGEETSQGYTRISIQSGKIFSQRCFWDKEDEPPVEISLSEARAIAARQIALNENLIKKYKGKMEEILFLIEREQKEVSEIESFLENAEGL